MARNTMALHVEQFPTGTYERAHRHGPGSTIILLDGSGFSMLWPPELGTTPFKDGKQSQVRMPDWKEGTLLVPPLQWYHQHFNSGKTPARFVKLGGWNNDLYPFTTTLVSDPGRTEIDYPNEDPRVRQIFAERLTATGGSSRCPRASSRKGRKIGRRGDNIYDRKGHDREQCARQRRQRVSRRWAISTGRRRLRGSWTRVEQAWDRLGVCCRPIAAVRERTPKTVPQAAVQAPECAVQDSFKHWTAARRRIDYLSVSVKKNKCEYLDCFHA